MSNIIAYADDIVVLAPSLQGLQALLSICYEEAQLLCLNYNFKKSFCMKFINGRQNFNSLTELKPGITLGSEILTFVNEIRYLGFNSTYNLCNKDDILKERNKFYNSFNSLLRKFHAADLFVFLTLFKSYCLQFYGSELWICNLNCKTSMNQFAIGFHKAVKKILGVGWGESNHEVCMAVGLVTFPHLIDIDRVKFIYRTLKVPPRFIEKNIVYFYIVLSF